MTAPAVVAVVRSARDMVAAGWTQKTFETPDGRMCLSRAVSTAAWKHLGYAEAPTVNEDEFTPLYFAAASAIQRQLPAGYWSLVQFNDNFHTTQADVVTLLEKTLAELGGLH